jgi:cob(I)alamin adenosyltransferase
MLEKGLIQIYTGSDDRISLVPFGLSLRAAGHNLKTHMTCFFPPESMDAARMASVLLKPYLVIADTTKGPAKINQSFQGARNALLSGEFDIVILNGIKQAWDQGLVSLSDLLELMTRKPDHVELVLSGPGQGKELMDRADLVTEMVCRGRKEDPYRFEEAGIPRPTEVVTGEGKGKTTYCLGKALLMSSLGIRATILQFIKSPQAYGEVKSIKRLPHMEIKTMGVGFLDVHSGGVPDRRHLEAARQAWKKCLGEIFSLKYGLIVLDEINMATHYGLIHPERVREMIFLRPQDLHLILSGRHADAEIIKRASSVIEMREIRHPFRKGIRARRGIEF